MLEWKKKTCNSDIVLYFFFLRVFDTVPLVYFCISLKYCGIEEAPTVACFFYDLTEPHSLLSPEAQIQSSDLRLRWKGFCLVRVPRYFLGIIILALGSWLDPMSDLKTFPLFAARSFFCCCYWWLSFKRSKCSVCCRFWSWSDLITVAEFVNLVRNSMWTQCLECASTKMPSFCTSESYPQCH